MSSKMCRLGRCPCKALPNAPSTRKVPFKRGSSPRFGVEQAVQMKFQQSLATHSAQASWNCTCHGKTSEAEFFKGSLRTASTKLWDGTFYPGRCKTQLLEARSLTEESRHWTHKVIVAKKSILHLKEWRVTYGPGEQVVMDPKLLKVNHAMQSHLREPAAQLVEASIDVNQLAEHR
mmetsp:Transcript_17108/g.30874  ORF Transcript_17108/g.30874 Transcript_17108/m.30874 type:complete len:176 (-) Transcript_17108:712-1239(-)